MCSALRFCLSVYLDLSPFGMALPPVIGVSERGTGTYASVQAECRGSSGHRGRARRLRVIRLGERGVIMVRTARRGRVEPEAKTEVIDHIRGASSPLRNSHDLDRLMERIGGARFVLLGEASHGTSEYYTWRAEITRRLIVEKGFQFIAVEGDWPSCDRLDQYIKGQADGDAEDALQAFDRWPSWMWANQEIAELAEWLKVHNHGRSEQVGFHGLDVYGLWDSLYSVIGYLRRVDPSAIDAARRAFRCFEPYGEDAQEYARATAHLVPQTCEDEAVALLADIRRKAPAYRED